jgi:uncharacterized protein (TIGR02757 family)
LKNNVLNTIYTHELKEFLEEKVKKFNRPAFIESDPIQVPKKFIQKENIEIAAFLTATISWGNRPVIIRNAMRLMESIDHRPFDFIVNAPASEYKIFKSFVHRTFNGDDCIYFLRSLKNIYENHGGLRQVFGTGFQEGGSVNSALVHFYSVFFEKPGERTRKHVANLERGASGKRLNMFLRWMVRQDSNGVDFGIWDEIPASALMLPLDVHTGNVARKLGILTRRQNDRKAVEEVTANLRKFDPEDPVKYDYALFGLGVFDHF